MDWESAIGDWDRHEWMQDHGEWVSSQWDGEREERAAARSALAAALTEAADAAEDGEEIDWAAIEAARARLDAADEAMEGAVEPDESDYIAEGTIDPDEVSSDPGVRIWSDSWQAWDCHEGQDVYVAASPEDGGIRLVHNWWRTAYGRRHQRDLWRIAEIVTEAREIAEILDAVAPRVARDIWAELAPSLGGSTRMEVAEHLSEDRRHDLGLDEEAHEADDEDGARTLLAEPAPSNAKRALV
jgi:hypothetical protein